MTTELTVLRMASRDGCARGELLWDGAHQCFTVEDEIRELAGVPVAQWKIAGKTAIPIGRYRLAIDYSNRFKRPMPHVLCVPGFEGIRIHTGNTAADVEGCAALGRVLTPNGVGESILAFDAFMPRLEAALMTGEVWITYKNPPPVIT